MARDRPSPYDEGRRFFGRIVLGPTDLRDVFSIARGMARDRPSPYEEGRLYAAPLHRDQEVSPTGDISKPIRAFASILRNLI